MLCNQTTSCIAFLFFRLPGICHNFVNVSLWLPILAAGSLIYEEQDCILRAGLWKMWRLSCNRQWRPGAAWEDCKTVGGVKSCSHSAWTYQLWRLPRRRNQNRILWKPLCDSPLCGRKRGDDVRRLPGLWEMPDGWNDSLRSSRRPEKFTAGFWRGRSWSTINARLYPVNMTEKSDKHNSTENGRCQQDTARFCAPATAI